jgi:molecular chaperone DnaK (HSP70)
LSQQRHQHSSITTTTTTTSWAPIIPSRGSSSLVISHAGRRWGGVRKKIEGDDDDAQNSSSNNAQKPQQPLLAQTKKRRAPAADAEEEEEEDPLAISDAMIDEAMGRARGEKPSMYGDAAMQAAIKAAQDDRDANGGTMSRGKEEPTRWSMEWLEKLSEEEMLALDKKRLMDFLLRDIESDKEWGAVPQQAVFAPDEEMDPKMEFYDEKMTEEIFGRMPEGEGGRDGEEDEGEDDDDLDLEAIFGALDGEGEDEDEDEEEEDLVRFLSQSQEGRKLAADLLNDDEMRSEEEDEDMFDLGSHLRGEEMSPEEVEEGLRHLLAGLKKTRREENEEEEDEEEDEEGFGGMSNPAALLAAVKASVEEGDLEGASELLQRMEELGIEVGDLEGEAEALENYRRPLTNKKQLVSNPSLEGGREGGVAVPLSGGRLSEEEVEAMKSVGACVGIDLGTTNSALSLIKDGRAIILPSRATGENVMPSVVRFRLKEGGKAEAEVVVVVGEEARVMALEDSDNTFSSVKRLMGRSLEELVKEKEILGSLNMVRHSFSEDEEEGGREDEEVDFKASSVAMYCPALRREVTPEEVSAEILKTLLGDAAAYLNQEINRAVITVPAYFTPAQCKATERAGELAGLQRIKLLREPEAAALAYGLDREMEEEELIMVFDLGGGTFDVSVLEVGEGVVEVLATFGDATLGGNDFDKRIADWIVSEYKKQHDGQGPPSDRVTQRRVMEAAEEARVRLSNVDKTEVALPGLGGKGKDLVGVRLTRQGMEGLCVDLFDRLLQPMRQAALMAGATLGGEVAPDALGGQLVDAMGEGGEEVAREVMMRELAEMDGEEMKGDKKKLAELMRERAMKGRQVSKARSNYNKNLNAVRKRNPGVKIREFPQGRVIQEVVMVGGATRMPSIQRLVEAVTGRKPRVTVNPDEAVALGAGIHAGVLDGTIEDMEMMTPMQAAIARGLMDFEARGGQKGPRSQKQKKGF